MDLDNFIAEPTRPKAQADPYLARLEDKIQNLQDLMEELLEQFAELTENGYTITRD